MRNPCLKILRFEFKRERERENLWLSRYMEEVLLGDTRWGMRGSHFSIAKIEKGLLLLKVSRMARNSACLSSESYTDIL